MQAPHKLDFRRIRTLKNIQEEAISASKAIFDRLTKAQKRLDGIEDQIRSAKNVLRGAGQDKLTFEIWTEKLTGLEEEGARELAEIRDVETDMEIKREQATAAGALYQRCDKYKRDLELDASYAREAAREEQQRIDSEKRVQQIAIERDQAHATMSGRG